MNTTRGTKAAFTPILVPTMNLVKGKMKVIRMMKGRLRKKLTTELSRVYTTLFSKRPPSLVRTRMRARMVARMVPTTSEKPTMNNVLSRAWARSPQGKLANITNHLFRKSSQCRFPAGSLESAWRRSSALKGMESRKVSGSMAKWELCIMGPIPVPIWMKAPGIFCW